MSLQFWANISTVWLALLCFISLLIPLAAAYFAIRGMNIALDKSRSGFVTAQGFTSVARRRVESVSHKVAEPVIKTESQVAKAETVARKLAERDAR